MPFTKDQNAAIIKAFTAKAKIARCPGCGENNWTLGQDLVFLQLTPPSSTELMRFGLSPGGGGPQLPTIVVICQTCGNTQFYNARVLGLDQALGLTISLRDMLKNG